MLGTNAQSGHEILISGGRKRRYSGQSPLRIIVYLFGFS